MHLSAIRELESLNQGTLARWLAVYQAESTVFSHNHVFLAFTYRGAGGSPKGTHITYSSYRVGIDEPLPSVNVKAIGTPTMVSEPDAMAKKNNKMQTKTNVC